MSETIYWAKVRPEAVIPSKRDEDAGWDLYCCFEEDYLVIEPLETKLIGLGVASAFPDDFVVFLKERGSTGKAGLSIRAGVVDSGYRGEYVLAVTNVNPYPIAILKDEKELPADLALPNWPKGVYRYYQGDQIDIYPYSKAICQAVILPVPKVEARQIAYEELLEMKSERGTGLMGSSGK